MLHCAHSEQMSCCDGRAVRRCKVALRAKAFGEKTNVGDLTTLPSDITSKAAIQHVYGSLPDLTVHITGETLPAFLGMQPGGLSPLMPKVRVPSVWRAGHHPRYGCPPVPRHGNFSLKLCQNCVWLATVPGKSCMRHVVCR